MASHPTSNLRPSNLQTGARVALVGILINVVLAAAKILAGVFGHAYVLIADGIESALDIAGSIVIWGGLKFAARPPDATHPYGHGKAEPTGGHCGRDWRSRRRAWPCRSKRAGDFSATSRAGALHARCPDRRVVGERNSVSAT